MVNITEGIYLKHLEAIPGYSSTFSGQKRSRNYIWKVTRYRIAGTFLKMDRMKQSSAHCHKY